MKKLFVLMINNLIWLLINGSHKKFPAIPSLVTFPAVPVPILLPQKVFF